MHSRLPNAASLSDETAPIYFMHIPKTAGTTFHAFLRRGFRDQEVCPVHLWRGMLRLDPVDVAARRLIWGHFYSYLHRHVPARMRYVIFLRDPVERALSHYGHILRHPDHYLHARALAAGSVAAFLDDEELATTMSNFQVRSLADDRDPHAAAEGLGPEQLAAGELERRLVAAPLMQSPDALLDIARTRLQQMCFVGISERYEESLRRFVRDFRWPHPADVEWLNVNPDRLPAAGLAADVLERLREMNRADYALYDEALRRFDAAGH